MSIIPSPFGAKVDAYTMTNRHGASLTVLSRGGIMQKLLIPDRQGRLRDVICGFDSVEDYDVGGGYQGALIGRYGNRIRDGRFALNGKTYRLACNEGGVTHLHGGDCGFDRRIWRVRAEEEQGYDRLILTYLSPDGEEGFPGNLSVKVSYTFTDDTVLHIDYEATCDADTPCNLTSHTYYNLSGYDGGSVMDHHLQLNADYYDSVDERMIPDASAPAPVKGTSFDHTTLGPISSPLDHNFHLRGEARERKHAATYLDPVSGRRLDLYTDMPAVQVYTACVMDGKTPFKGGVPQRLFHAIALETQFAPDSPNRPDMPSCILRAGQTFRSRTTLVFSVEEEQK